MEPLPTRIDQPPGRRKATAIAPVSHLLVDEAEGEQGQEGAEDDHHRIVDPAAGARNARERGLDRVVRATLDQCRIAPGSLPAAGLFDVLEHIEDSTGFLRRLHALAAPAGRLVLTVPAYSSLWSDADERAGHYRRYTRRSLVRELADAGWRVERTTYLFAFLPPVIGLLRTLPYRLGLTGRDTAGRPDRDHAESVASGALRALLATEAACIRRRWTIPFGGSLLALARR